MNGIAVSNGVAVGSYWTPAAFTAEVPGSGPLTVRPLLEALQGAWDHSNVGGPIIVRGNSVWLGKGRFEFSLSSAGLVTGIAEWDLISFDGQNCVWQADGDSCTWSRKVCGPKRGRVVSQRQREAERDAAEVGKWIRGQRRQANHPKCIKLADKSNKRPTACITQKQPVEPVVVPRRVTDAELRRLNKQMNKRFQVVQKDADDSGFSGSGIGKAKRVSWLHKEQHDPSEWGGWQRLAPHSRSYEVTGWECWGSSVGSRVWHELSGMMSRQLCLEL